MREFNLDPDLVRTIERTILITGAARTGTTMIGQLVGSFENVEYAFEPAGLLALINTIHEIPREIWKFLFSTYVFEDLLVESLAGRRLNVNPHDDSSAIKIKTAAEIADRLGRSHRRRELFSAAKNHRMAVKIPDLTGLVETIASTYSSIAVVVTVRRPDHVVQSTRAKGWFARGDHAPHLGPASKSGAFVAPIWLPIEEVDRWFALDELGRCCLYCATAYEAAVRSADRAIIVDYDDFVADPDPSLRKLADRLGCRYGPMTSSLIQGIDGGRGLSPVDMSDAPRDLVDRMVAAAETLKAHAL